MQLSFYSYHFPFKQAFATSNHAFRARKGVLIQLQKNGITAWGEAAPLPGFSRKSLDELMQQIRHNNSQIKSYFQKTFLLHDLHNFVESKRLCPSLKFALFTVATVYLAQKRDLSIHRFLWDDPTDSITLNAVIDLNHITKPKMEKIIKHGFNTLKIKVAEDAGFIEQIKSLRERHPDVHIRLDANQCWLPDEARRFLQKAEAFNIEYCEEPLKQPTPENLQKLRQQTTVPIALDESLIHSFNLNQAKNLADVLVIKPMVLAAGSTPGNLQSWAIEHDKKIILTSSLESGIGRLLTATLAAGLAPDAAHGIATGDLLERDVWDDQVFISDGSYNLPSFNKLQSLMHINPSEHSLSEIPF